ncbi:MAG: M23 family metallopeptidase [Bacteroidetes bacterium]|nr:MAG: M23 family metallopeptidase [Bacteroidota bacterium]
MKHFFFILISFLSFYCCVAQEEYSIQDLKSGKFKEDSSYIYLLPFENKKKVFLIQAYESKMSHKGERALDFKVKKGTKICAARDGVVIAAREDSDEGGLKPENLSDGNYISIQHKDGSVAHYWHLKKEGAEVNVGDTVSAGQLIGESGNTGYSAFPHLHFEVVGNDVSGNYKQLATRFKTKKGIKYLRPSKFYRAIH